MSANKMAIEMIRELQGRLRTKHTRAIIDKHKSPSKMESDGLSEDDIEALLGMPDGASEEADEASSATVGPEMGDMETMPKSRAPSGHLDTVSDETIEPVIGPAMASHKKLKRGP